MERTRKAREAKFVSTNDKGRRTGVQAPKDVPVKNGIADVNAFFQSPPSATGNTAPSPASNMNILSELSPGPSRPKSATKSPRGIEPKTLNLFGKEKQPLNDESNLQDIDKTSRRKPRQDKFHELGQKGRKTGVTPGVVPRNSDGTENVNAFYNNELSTSSSSPHTPHSNPSSYQQQRSASISSTKRPRLSNPATIDSSPPQLSDSNSNSPISHNASVISNAPSVELDRRASYYNQSTFSVVDKESVKDGSDMELTDNESSIYGKDVPYSNDSLHSQENEDAIELPNVNGNMNNSNNKDNDPEEEFDVSNYDQVPDTPERRKSRLSLGLSRNRRSSATKLSNLKTTPLPATSVRENTNTNTNSKKKMSTPPRSSSHHQNPSSSNNNGNLSFLSTPSPLSKHVNLDTDLDLEQDNSINVDKDESMYAGDSEDTNRHVGNNDQSLEQEVTEVPEEVQEVQEVQEDENMQYDSEDEPPLDSASKKKGKQKQEPPLFRSDDEYNDSVLHEDDQENPFNRPVDFDDAGAEYSNNAGPSNSPSLEVNDFRQSPDPTPPQIRNTNVSDSENEGGSDDPDSERASPPRSIAKNTRTTTAARGRKSSTRENKSGPSTRTTSNTYKSPVAKNARFASVEIREPAPVKTPDPSQSGVRRSNRVTMKPLEYWRNERIVYTRRTSGAAAHYGMKEIVRVPPSEPEYGKAGSRSRSKSRARSTGPNGRGYANRHVTAQPPEENNTETFIATGAHPEKSLYADWDTNTDQEGTVLEYFTEKEVRRRIAFTHRMLEPIARGNHNYRFQKIFVDGQYMAGGMLEIPPQQSKHQKDAKDNTYMFYVVSGVVRARVHRTELTVAEGGFFLVPRGNTYLIDNISDIDDAKLVFMQSREVPAEDYYVEEDEGEGQEDDNEDEQEEEEEDDDDEDESS